MLGIKTALKHWVFWLPISEGFSKLVEIYNGFILRIFWIMWSRVCLAIYSEGNLSIFRCCVLTNLAGKTRNSVRMVSKVA